MRRIILSFSICLLLTGCYYRPDTPRGSFAKGADISWLSEQEADGVRFFNADGESEDCILLMRDMGMNAVRLRVWVNHSTGWCNKEDVVYKARRAAQSGLRIMIDFHYSDNFADPSHQAIPAAWRDYTYEQMRQAVFEHTLDVLNALKEARVRPEWVQVGNETPNGMLWPMAFLPDSTENTGGCWERYAGLTTAGYKAVKEVFPEAQVIVHVDNAWQLREWFFRNMLLYGGKFDMIGLSHYPMMLQWSGKPWHEMNSLAEQNIRQLIHTFHCPVMVTEVGTLNSDEQLAVTVMQDFVSRIGTIDSCAGIFYWEPQCYGGWKPNEYDALGWGPYDMGCFHADGTPSEVLEIIFN